MPTDMKLPELGENIEGGDVLRVMVKAGDAMSVTVPSVEERHLMPHTATFLVTNVFADRRRFALALGVPVDALAEEWLARAFCHEIDHLNGVMFRFAKPLTVFVPLSVKSNA